MNRAKSENGNREGKVETLASRSLGYLSFGIEFFFLENILVFRRSEKWHISRHRNQL